MGLQTKEMPLPRATLCGCKTERKKVDMEAVYKFLDEGHTIKDACEKFEVSRSTLYRGHKKYQDKLVAVACAGEEKREGRYRLPPLPTDL